MSALNNSALLGASGSTGYQISRSVRLRASASAYLNRTYGAPTNNKVWTWSAWIKRGSLSLADANHLFLASPQDVGSNPTSYSRLVFETDNTLRLQSANSAGEAFTSSAVYRDSSAWYHIVLYMDAANTTVRAYVNGVEISYASRTNPTNTNTVINGSGNYHRIGLFRSAEPRPFDGYITEVNFIDGQALTPSSFGETNTTTGVWQPKRYTGTYGTNGFYLNFSDNSNNTATTIGKDYSGNGNNWTPNNISVTAGVTYDSMIDVPTQFADGGNGRGNYSTLNPLNNATTLSAANLDFQGTGAAPRIAVATMQCTPSGKTYFEMRINTVAGAANNSQAGIVPAGISLTDYIGTSSGRGYAIEQDGTNAFYLRLNGSTVGPIAVTPTSGDVIQVAVDLVAGKLWLGRNNTWYNSAGGTTGNPSAGTNETATISTSSDWFPAVQKYNTSGSYSVNFGAGSGFSYTPPTGFKALNTLNLPQPTILKGNQYMNVVTYTATPGTGNTISGVGFQTDLLWTKNRDNVEQHYWQDSVRGFSPSVGVTQMLSSNSTAAEASVFGITCTTTSDGFTVVDSVPGSGEFWFTNRTYVAWCWRANGTPAVTNTAGSITSTISAGATQGFSIVTYTGTGANATVGHGLGVAPDMIIVKRRSATDSWPVYHSRLTSAANTLILNSTAAQGTVTTYWNSTAPTSSVFTVGTDSAVNASGSTYVAYCFDAVAGFSAFGSYTGNGSADGPFVFCGFRPEFVMIKRTDASNDWVILDTARNTFNVANSALFPNSTSSETSNGFYDSDILSNGFKVRATNAVVNASGGTYIYAAFAETPFKNALAR